MKKTFIVEDSSFIVALMNKADLSHEKALFIFKKLLSQYSRKVRIVIPTTVIFEALFALIRNRTPILIAQQKLWKLLMVLDILNATILETTALRLCRKVEPIIHSLPQNAILPANDLIVIATAIEYENALVLTFDRVMKNRFSKIYPQIFYGLDEEERDEFFKAINDAEIPF